MKKCFDTRSDSSYNLDSATINANDFNLTVGGLFANRYDAKISANGFNVSVGDIFTIQMPQQSMRMLLLSPQILLSIVIQEEMVIFKRIY